MTASPRAQTVALLSHQNTSSVVACSSPTTIPQSMGTRIVGCEAKGTVAAWWLIAWRAAVSTPCGAWASATSALHRSHDVIDGAARLSRVALVVDERLVRRGADGAVNAGARQVREVVL